MEIISSVAGPIVGNVTDCLLGAGLRQLGYLFHYGKNIEALKRQAKELTGTRGSIKAKVEAAKRNGEIILPEVEHWMVEVEKISASAEKLLEGEDEANKRCFKGLCINIGSRYRFSKKVKKHNLKISDKLQKAGKFENVSSSPPPARIISSLNLYSGTFESRQLIMNEIMEALVDENVSIVGICGMGGVGKTTLVKEIGKHFDVLAMAVVSHNADILKIQDEIAQMLGFTKLADKAEFARAPSLWGRIKQEERILVILDDVWERIELDKIGIPFGKDHGGCKIIITSRRKNVCEQMDCQKIITVGTLSKEESWVLFKEIAGSNVENPDINAIARDVADECGGLPIAIVTVARALKNKDKYVWFDALQQLQKSTSTNIEGMHKNVISSLELSYNHLESEETKSLFLFCSLFPEDFNIFIEDLVRYATGLRWFQDLETTEAVRVRTHALVSSLISSFLLIAGDRNDKNYVKMHDVVRDVALIIAPKYKHLFMVKAGVKLREWPHRDSFEEFTAISLMFNDIQEVPDRLACPNLNTLLLQRNKNLIIPNSFFQEMKDLKVLDLSQTKLLPLPESASLLAHVRVLHLDFCNLGDLSVIGSLSKLEILSLFGSNIKEIPTSFSKLSHLRLLDLNKCRGLKLIPRGVISCFHKLEELYMIESFRDWDFEEKEGQRSNASLVELQVLSRLNSLQIYVPENNTLPNDMLPVQNLTNFILEIGIRDYDWDASSYMRNKKLSLRKISKLPYWIKHLSKRSEKLFLSEITENSFHELVNEGFNDLKSLKIKSHEIKYLLNILEWTPSLTFHNLEELKIDGSSNLVEICHGQPPVQSFRNLKVLAVNECKSVLTIVPNHLAQRLQSLETLQVNHCESMVYAFDLEGLHIAKGETEMLSSLKVLELEDLPKMTQIWKGDHRFIDLCNLKSVRLLQCPKLIQLFSPALLKSLSCLEDIDIRSCSELKEIFEKREAEDQEKEIVSCEKDHTSALLSLGNLTNVIISDCNKLKNLFTSSIVKSLVKLKKLGLRRCSNLQEIVTNEDGDKGVLTTRMVFPSLYYMELGQLSSLTCFSSGLYVTEFPALEELLIYGCPKMKTFGYGEQVTPKLKKVRVEGEDHWKGNVNDTVQQIFK